MTRERIEDFREIVLPFLSRTLLKTNYENMGKSDAEEFEKDFNEILDLAIKALEQEPKTGYWVHGEYCSECGCDVPAYIIDWKWQKDMNAKYCPNCGARMVEPQESEDTE